MKITALKLSAIAIGATVLVGLFISCKDEGNTLSYDNASNKKNSIEEPTIVVKLINENNNDSSFWIGYETFYDELIKIREQTGISFSRLVNGSIKQFIDKYNGK